MKPGDTVKVDCCRGQWEFARVVEVMPIDPDWVKLLSKWATFPHNIGDKMLDVAILPEHYNRKWGDEIKRGRMRAITKPIVMRYAEGEVRLIWQEGNDMPEWLTELRHCYTEDGEHLIGFYFGGVVCDAVINRQYPLVRYDPTKDCWIIKKGGTQ